MTHLQRAFRLSVVAAVCLGLVGCDWIRSWFSSGATTPIPVNITVVGGTSECPLGNVRLFNTTATVSVTGGQTVVAVAVMVECVMSAQRTPMQGVTLKVSGTPLQPDDGLGPTNSEGKAERNFASSEPVASLVGRSFELRVVGSDGNPYPTSPATTVTVTQQ